MHIANSIFTTSIYPDADELLQVLLDNKVVTLAIADHQKTDDVEEDKQVG